MHETTHNVKKTKKKRAALFYKTDFYMKVMGENRKDAKKAII